MDFGIPEDYRPSPSSNQHSGPVVVEDLIQGLNEWRNIQDIVRITFKAFHDVLKAQGEAIKTLERALETKVSRSEVQTVLDQKANTAEVAQRLREVETALFSKADIVDVERRALKTELDASLKIHMTDVYAVIGTKADDSDVRVWKDQVDRSHQQLRAEVLQLGTGLHNVVTQVDMKANISDVSAALATKADAAEVEEVLRDKVSCKAMGEALARKAEKTATDTLESDMHSVSTHLQQVEHIVESNAAVTSQELQSLRTGLDNTAKELKRALDLQGSRLTHVQEEVQQQSAQHKEGLSLKADYKEMQRLLAAKAETSQVNDALATKANTATVRALIDKLEQAVVAAGKTDILQQDMASKANTKDVCTLLDGKANIEDVNKALLQVCQELENKAGLEELDRALKDQSIINASLCADMSLGRWLWKSTKTKQGGAVPWNVQTLNSDPENFLWEKDKATIMTVVPGLYEVTFGFFSKKKPTVQLLVNGEPVLSAVNSSSYVIHHSSGRLATVSAHPAGNVTGLTCIDFLSLPPRAKLAITYQGEEKGEGFFCVKKL